MERILMDISLNKANLEDAEIIYDMKIKSFMPLLEKYKDFDTSPANEPIEKIIMQIKQSFTDYYIIKKDDINVGGIRIAKLDNNRNRVSPVFIMPEYQGKGVAQKVFQLVERIYNDINVWELDTILQEQGNCYLYEKLGYRRTGKIEVVNSNMTLVYYEKNGN
jgi:GNAT superfamily N-acetyltransferase